MWHVFDCGSFMSDDLSFTNGSAKAWSPRHEGVPLKVIQINHICHTTPDLSSVNYIKDLMSYSVSLDESFEFKTSLPNHKL